MPSWAYGVTTCPVRRDTLLPGTLASLAAGGFDRPRLFVDGGGDWNGWIKSFPLLDVTLRGGPPVRTFGNWVLSLGELYCRDPRADLYAVFQDDFCCVRNLRRYLELSARPDEPHYLNLYTMPVNQSLAPRVKGKRAAGADREYRGHRIGWFRSNQLGKGAVALVMSRDRVIQLLRHAHILEKPQSVSRGHRNADGAIVTAFKGEGIAEYCHHPSLVQHRGLVSSMGNKRHPLANSFPGEGFDALDWTR